jgi:hypothetical protein
MPKDRIEFDVSATVQDALDALRAAAERKGWSVQAGGPHRLQLKQGMNMTAYAVKLDVNLVPSTDRATTIRVDGRVDGWGPIQKRALGEALNSLQSEVLSALPQEAAGASPEAQVEALKSLSELRDKGALTEDEFVAQKAKILDRD